MTSGSGVGGLCYKPGRFIPVPGSEEEDDSGSGVWFYAINRWAGLYRCPGVKMMPSFSVAVYVTAGAGLYRCLGGR
jgi:hypothetical protein